MEKSLFLFADLQAILLPLLTMGEKRKRERERGEREEREKEGRERRERRGGDGGRLIELLENSIKN